MKAYGGVDAWFHTFLISVLDEGAWLTSHSGHCIYGESPPPCFVLHGI